MPGVAMGRSSSFREMMRAASYLSSGLEVVVVDVAKLVLVIEWTSDIYIYIST